MCRGCGCSLSSCKVVWSPSGKSEDGYWCIKCFNNSAATKVDEDALISEGF